MKDEIKEILDFKEDADYKRLSVDEIVILKDYITNLQEELEEQKRIEQADFKLIQELEEKNDRLKEINKEQANHLISKDNLSYEDYKSRNEKAIEILKQDKASASFNTAERIALNILQGKDK